jgi:phosphatidylserine decarboxylase
MAIRQNLPRLIKLQQPAVPRDPIRYFDRYDGKTKVEKIFGEPFLRFAYENPVGRFAVWLLFRRAFFSWYYGRRMSKPESAIPIIKFIGDYEINAQEFAKSPFEFKTFNEFFHRALKPEARPISPGANIAVFPADGRHLAFLDIDRADGFYVKGAKFTVEELLGDAELASRLAGGSMLISRLCPSDYHRFHFPVAGIPAEARLVGGRLYSVSPIALRRNIHYLVRNKRFVTKVDSSLFGTVAMVEVGATNVGSIVEGFVPGRPVLKGEEKGLFAFGGSCVITLFARSRIVFDPDIVRQSAAHVETYARMGDRLGQATRGP